MGVLKPRPLPDSPPPRVVGGFRPTSPPPPNTKDHKPNVVTVTGVPVPDNYKGPTVEKPIELPPPPSANAGKSAAVRDAKAVLAGVEAYRLISDLNYEVGYLQGSLMGLRYVDAENVGESIDRILQDHAALESKRHKMPGSTC